MAENLRHGYSAKIYTRGAIWSLRINDIFIRENTDVAYSTSSGNVGLAMQPGKNTLSLLFSPITGKNPETGEYEYELRDGVFIDIIIARTDYVTRESQEVHPIRIRYDGDTGKFVNDPKTEGGEDRVLQQPLIRASEKHQISALENQDIVLRSGQRFGGYRLDVEFEVEDEAIPPMHWVGEAVPLEDSPELRRELLQAYERIYSMVERGDKEAIFREAEPIWKRSAFILTSLPSARAVFEEHAQDQYQKHLSDGSILQPLTFISDMNSASLQFMAENRLVRVRPDPIRWEHPPVGSDSYTTFPVVFYKTADGEWHLADINTGL